MNVMNKEKDKLTNKELFINDKPFYINNLIAKGGFGVVYKAYDREKKEYVAIKKIKKKYFALNIMEILISMSIDHPYINTSEYFQKDGDLFFVQDLAICDLMSHIKTSRISENILLKWTSQILQSLSFLHTNNIIHGDVKPSNILLCPNGDIKLTDFSFTRISTDKNKGDFCTNSYKPLEILEDQVASEKTDIWSLGCTLYQLKYRKNLFSSQDKDTIKPTLRKKYLNLLIQWAELTHQKIHFPEYFDCEFTPLNIDLKLFENVEDGVFFDIIIMKMLNIYAIDRPSSTQLICDENFDNFKVYDGSIKCVNINCIENKINSKPFKNSFMKICDKEELSYPIFKKVLYCVKYWKLKLKNENVSSAMSSTDKLIHFSIWLCKKMCNINFCKEDKNETYEFLSKHFFRYYNYKAIII